MIENDLDDGAPTRDRSTFSLRRWSQRKHEVAREARTNPRAPETGSVPPVAADPLAPGAQDVASGASVTWPGIEQAAPASPSTAPPVAVPLAADLPPVDTLTVDSDFSPFMRPGVDAGLRREALKKLLHDRRFNVMDGLDVYIDDYTKSKPIEPSLARELLARLHPRASAEPVPPDEAAMLPVQHESDGTDAAPIRDDAEEVRIAIVPESAMPAAKASSESPAPAAGASTAATKPESTAATKPESTPATEPESTSATKSER
ncbi:MAG: DUF3306 domain-containing protein [Casimicrobiaceae bacterium]